MTAPTIIRCTWAGCRDQANVREDGYAFCGRHVLSHRQVKAEDQQARAQQPTSPAAATIGVLLEQASAHPSAKVRRLAERTEDLLRELRRAIAEDAAQAEVRAEVARLEKALATAKAKLVKTPSSAVSSPRYGGEHACRKGCGKVSPSPQGRAAHERHCAGAAA